MLQLRKLETEKVNNLPKATWLLSSRARIPTQMFNLYTEHCREGDDLDCGGSCGHGEQERLFSSQAVHTVYALGCDEVEILKTASQKMSGAGKGRSQEV